MSIELAGDAFSWNWIQFNFQDLESESIKKTGIDLFDWNIIMARNQNQFNFLSLNRNLITPWEKMSWAQ